MASMRKKVSTRWVGADGKRCPPNTPGAKKVQERSDKYYAFGVPGAPRPIPLASNRRVAEQMLAQLVAGGESAVAGLPTTADRSVLVAEWIERYCLSMRADGDTDYHVDQIKGKLLRLAAGIAWTVPRLLTADAVNAWLHQLLTVKGRSPQTRNHYLAAVKGFVRWLSRPPRRLLPGDVLVNLGKLPTEVDQRRARRSLTVAELGTLLAVTLTSAKVCRGLTGTDRHALYSTACATGFRAGELAMLTPAHLLLDNSPPVALLPARTDKARRVVRQPLPPDVVALLRTYTQGMPSSQPIWPQHHWWEKAALVLRRDLTAAGIPYRMDGPDGPLYADFHSLRHTYVALLEIAGVSLRDAMQLARHSDPRLTLARYGRSQLEGLGRAVNALPVFGAVAGVELTPAEKLFAWLLACTGLPLGCPADGQDSIGSDRIREDGRPLGPLRRAA